MHYLKLRLQKKQAEKMKTAIKDKDNYTNRINTNEDKSYFFKKIN